MCLEAVKVGHTPPQAPPLPLLPLPSPQGDELKALFEQVAKLQFSERRNPEDCALLYLSLGKKKQLQALCKAVRNERLHAFLSNDFSEPRWRSAAMKNAYALLSKQQYELCAAFFVLGGEVDSAVRVCARQLNDVQLALLLCRLHADGWPSLLQSTVQEEVAPAAAASADRWLACVGHLLLGEAQQAIDALAHHIPPQPTQPSPQPTDLPPRASGLPSNAAAMGGVLLADACVPALCDAVHSQPKWRLRPSPLPSQLLLRCAHAWRMAGMPLCAMTSLQRAGGETGEVVLLDACAALLLSRSQEHLGSPPASPSQCALALTSTTRALREDLQVGGALALICAPRLYSSELHQVAVIFPPTCWASNRDVSKWRPRQAHATCYLSINGRCTSSPYLLNRGPNPFIFRLFYN